MTQIHWEKKLVLRGLDFPFRIFKTYTSNILEYKKLIKHENILFQSWNIQFESFFVWLAISWQYVL